MSIFFNYSQHTIIYWFQWYSIVITDLYNAQGDHCTKTSAILPYYIFVTTLLTIFLLLYFSSPSPSCNYPFVFLIPLTLFCCPLQFPSHLVAFKIFSVSMSLFLLSLLLLLLVLFFRFHM